MLPKMEGGALAYVDANFNIRRGGALPPGDLRHARQHSGGGHHQPGGGRQCEVVLSDDSSATTPPRDRVDVVPLELDVPFGNMYTKEIEAFGR